MYFFFYFRAINEPKHWKTKTNNGNDTRNTVDVLTYCPSARTTGYPHTENSNVKEIQIIPPY